MRRARGESGLLLRLVIGVNTGTILSADVIALTHPLGRVMRFPKRLQQSRVTHFVWIVYHAYDFIVPGSAAAHLFIRRVGRMAAGIADGRGIDPGDFPKRFLRAPEAAETEQRQLHTFRKWRRDAIVINEVLLRYAHLFLASG